MPSFPQRILFCTAILLPLSAAAQMHHVDKPEQVTRAVGVYEWTGELNKPGQARLVPVSLFISGRFQAAGTYLARPVPFALETGNVYSIERAGHSLGTLDINLARDIADSRSQADDNPEGVWYGYGQFATPHVAKAKPLAPVKTVGQVEGTQDDDRPHFVASRNQPDSTPADTKTASHPTHADTEETERPTLGRRSESTPLETADNGKEKKPKREKPQGYVTGVGGGLNDDPDRPTLGRSKGEAAAVAPLVGLPAGMHQAIAVSDPAVRDEHVFTREWDSASERAEILTKLHTLAEAQVRSYMQTNALVPGKASAVAAAKEAEDTSGPPTLRRTPHGISTSTQVKPAPAKKPALKNTTPALLVLGDEQIFGYNLSYGGLPVFVYIAAVPARPTQAQSADVKVYVAIVAQQLPSGELQIALSSVTDSAHTDRTPWMRFVDVVDADGSHRASLLFEMRQAHARQFALYRLISAQAEQTFVTPLIE
jgi:hypothetical protein